MVSCDAKIQKTPLGKRNFVRKISMPSWLFLYILFSMWA